MKKLAINYNRSFPDHRVSFDHQFNKQLMQGPSTYFKVSSTWNSYLKMDSMQAWPKISTSTSHSQPSLSSEY